jgi:ABC-type transport system substrate-binding protein
VTSFNTHQPVGLVYNRLLAFEIGPDTDQGAQNLIGDLAESWEVADDGLMYTFNLRKGVKWQNVPPLNGREFVADDVIATSPPRRSPRRRSTPGSAPTPTPTTPAIPAAGC